MHPVYVPFKVGSFPEKFAAKLAFESSDSLVNDLDVPFEIRHFPEFPVALGTFKFTDSFMNDTDVPVQVSLRIKSSFTLKTLERRHLLIVNPSQVFLQISALAEIFLAQLAQELSYPFVNDFDVLGKMRFRRLTLWTILADEIANSFVNGFEVLRYV